MTDDELKEIDDYSGVGGDTNGLSGRLWPIRQTFDSFGWQGALELIENFRRRRYQMALADERAKK